MTTIELNGFVMELQLSASRLGGWITLPLTKSDRGFRFDDKGISGELTLRRSNDRIAYRLGFSSDRRTRIRLQLSLLDQTDLLHLIPSNIHGDNNAAHVRQGEFPCLTTARPWEKNCASRWEFRADRASHPVSMLCCTRAAAGVSIDPYSDCDEVDDGFIRNGVFAALPNAFGVSLGYGNDPLTFNEKTDFRPATADLVHRASANGTIWALAGNGRTMAHRIIRDLHERMREVPKHKNNERDALRALADAFVTVNWSPELGQYTNRKCSVPVDRTLKPWRAIVEIGWTGGSMLAYPFLLAERIFPDLRFPKGSKQIFDEICSGYEEGSGFINDAALNRFVKNRPDGWNDSEINGWWSGFLPQTRGNHCAYTQAHAAYYLLRAAATTLGAMLQAEFVFSVGATPASPIRGAERATQASPLQKCGHWNDVALRILDTAMELQRDDGAFGYIFSSREKKVVDYDGFAGCWFAAALALAWKITADTRYRDSAARSMDYYATFVRDLACWGTPMDTFKSVDSEGNLAFIRAARLMHEFTGEEKYLQMLRDGAHYEYLWRYGFRTRPECPPLKGSNWNSCGGSITSVSNPHIHPMSVVATDDLEYLSRVSDDPYHQQRADDGIAWLMNTMELYPDITGYGQYGVLSERTCPSDGLLSERFADDGSPSSTWFSYNAWAAGSAMEALAERILARENR
jgi:hypothetical protein